MRLARAGVEPHAVIAEPARGVLDRRQQLPREPASSPAARTLLAAMEQEMFDLYDMTRMPTPASTAELEPPSGGAYVVGWEDGRAVAGGALKRLEPGVAEIKRMYVVPDARGRGLARELLAAIEDTARGLGYERVRLDKAGQKGTGRWTSQVALDLGVAIPTIAAAIDGRVLSSLKSERVEAAKQLAGPTPGDAFRADSSTQVIDDLRDALYAARVCAYAQGMALIRAGSDRYSWSVDLAEIGRIWKGGCIIRARLLDPVRHAFGKQPSLVNLLLDPALGDGVEAAQAGWRRTIARGASAGLPLGAHAAALSYFDSYRAPRLPQNLTQAQRDAFGAHTYERVDRPGAVHSEW